LNAKPAQHLEFAPPPQPGAGRAWLAAGLVHGLLFLALGLATAWKTQPQTIQAEAELWSATPQAAAPRLQEPPPESQPQAQPMVKPSPPPPPAPDPEVERIDAQIALEKKKQLEKKKEAEKAEKLKAEKEKKAKDKADKEKAELKRKEREKERAKEDKAKEKEKEAKEKKAQEEKERDKKKAAEKADTAKFEALRADARKDQMKNMQKGLAGASGGENASGTALKSSGPSSSYGGKIVREILDKTTNADITPGALTVVVFVRANASGEILSSRVITSSGSRAFDDSVIRGIQKMERVPKDVDGKIPEILIREGLELTVSR
jgi:colicin import membrane protein